ncbi:MAG: alanine racemase [Tepidisphaeraceae bacterium]|jgi:alanine racemase
MDAKNAPKPNPHRQTIGEPRCLISRAAILHNIGVIRRAIAPHVKICAVVKADAYGHGVDLVVDTLCNFSGGDVEPPMVDALAVADIDEAAALADCNLPIIILRPAENAFLGTQRSRIEMAVDHGWVLTICSGGAADDVARIAAPRQQRANVQIMVNTGLNRAGAETAATAKLIEKIVSLPSLRLVGLATHFATADDANDPRVSEQLSQFLAVTQPPCLAGRPTRPHRTAANSAGIFLHPDSHLDMVRPGISLYGIDPTLDPSIKRPLRPAMRWTAPLIGIRNLPTGASVGYGHTWTAERPTRVGLVPIGYADGYPRLLSNKGTMMVNGQPARVLGRVSMDLTVIDLQSAPHAMIGDEVIVLDNDPLSPASVYAIAELAGTIPYEIFCRIGPRVLRVAVDDFAPAPKRHEYEGLITAGDSPP